MNHILSNGTKNSNNVGLDSNIFTLSLDMPCSSDNHAIINAINNIITDDNHDSNCSNVKFEGKELRLCADIISSKPLLYRHRGNHIDIALDYISGMDITIPSGFKKSGGYILGHETFYQGFRRVPANSTVVINAEEANTHRRIIPRVEAREFSKFDFDKVMRSSLLKIKELSNAGYKILVPLSSGLDSRLIFFTLYEMGIPFECFTYGRVDSIDIKIAKTLTTKLDVTWHPIILNKQLLDSVLSQVDLRELIPKVCRGVSIPHLQDLPALISLRDKNLINDMTVVLPGHTGDFISGGHIWEELYFRESVNLSEIVSYLSSKHLFTDSDQQDTIRAIVSEIMKDNGYHEEMSSSEAEDVMFVWEMEERQSKYIANSIALYNAFGVTTYMPFWNENVVSYFRSLSIHDKREKIKYKAYIKELGQKLGFCNLYENDSLFREYLFSVLRKRFPPNYRTRVNALIGRKVLNKSLNMISDHSYYLAFVLKDDFVKSNTHLNMMQLLISGFVDDAYK
jgi:asparagine synthase (glutamine-hydrolysing)